MTAQIVKLRPSRSRLECSACGASVDASCDCGASYVPAVVRAAKAVTANPEKSDRAIAADIGVSKDTVRRARESTGAHAPVDKRVGQDGKARKLPRPKSESPRVRQPKASDPIHEQCVDCDTQEQYWQRSLSNLAGDAISMPAYWTREFGSWEKFEAPTSLVKLAKQAAQTWMKLADDLAKK